MTVSSESAWGRLLGLGALLTASIDSHMALGAITYNVEVHLADHDRQVYESIELKLARHNEVDLGEHQARYS